MESRNTAIFDACQCPASSSDEVRAVFVDAPSRVLGAVKGRLGIYTNLSSTPVFTRVPGGQGETADEGEEHRKRRAERWRLKWKADELRGFVGRASACHRARLRKDKAVELKLSEQRKRAFFTGLQICGSVWQCPICAAKVSERRRVELTDAIGRAQSQGLRVLLLTLTVRHGLGDDVKLMLKRMSKALGRCSSDRKAKEVRASMGLVGTVRTLEVTDGPNGFHPHLHILLFIRSDWSLQTIEDAWANLWIDACIKVGLPEPVRNVACKVEDGSKAAKYVGKWGMVEEVTKGHLKHGRKGGRTPWDLLRAAADGDNQAGRRWLIFADAFKGQVQLRWSPGLRALLGMPSSKSDKELAEAEIDLSAKVLAELTDIERQALVSTKSLPQLLDIAEKSPSDVRSFIDSRVRLYLRSSAGRDQRRAIAQDTMRELADLAG